MLEVIGQRVYFWHALMIKLLESGWSHLVWSKGGEGAKHFNLIKIDERFFISCLCFHMNQFSLTFTQHLAAQWIKNIYRTFSLATLGLTPIQVFNHGTLRLNWRLAMLGLIKLFEGVASLAMLRLVTIDDVVESGARVDGGCRVETGANGLSLGWVEGHWGRGPVVVHDVEVCNFEAKDRLRQVLWPGYSSWCHQNMARLNYGRV